jgi:hypothetical protein
VSGAIWKSGPMSASDWMVEFTPLSLQGRMNLRVHDLELGVLSSRVCDLGCAMDDGRLATTSGCSLSVSCRLNLRVHDLELTLKF